MDHTTPITFPEDETFDIGQDTRTGVALVEYRYDVPFKFTGKINKLTFKLEPFPPEQKAVAAPPIPRDRERPADRTYQTCGKPLSSMYND